MRVKSFAFIFLIKRLRRNKTKKKKTSTKTKQAGRDALRCLFPGLYSEGPRSVKINDLPDMICCCGCAKMSALFTGRLPGPDGVEAPTPDPRNRDGGRVRSGIHCVPGDGSGLSAGGLGRCTRLSFVFSFCSPNSRSNYARWSRGRGSSLMPLTARYGPQSCRRWRLSTFPSETTFGSETLRVGRSAGAVIPFIPFYLYI